MSRSAVALSTLLGIVAGLDLVVATYVRDRARDRPLLYSPSSYNRSGAKIASATPFPPRNTSDVAFPGPDGGSVPDCSIAVGLTSVVAVTNQGMAIYRKDGTQVASSLTTVLVGATIVTGFRGDPKVVFDRFSDRFFVTASSGSDKGTAIWLAVSKTSDPLTLTTADWFIYRLPAQNRGSTPTQDSIDYPQLGVGVDTLVIATVMIDPVGQIPDEVIRVYPKTPFLSGSQAPVSTDFFGQIFPNPYSYIVREFQPAVHRTASSTFFLLTQGPAPCAVTVWGIDLGSGAGSMQSAGVSPPTCDGNVDGNDVVSQSGGPGITVGPLGFTRAVYVNGTLWGARLVRRVHNATPVTAVMWYQIDVSSWPAISLTQSGVVSESAASYAYSAIVPDSLGNAVLILNRFSADSYPTLSVAGRMAADPSGIMRGPLLVKNGRAPSNAIVGGRNRWGDFTGIDFDPADGSWWSFGEYTKEDGSGGTWITRLTVPGIPSFDAQPSSQTIPHGTQATLSVATSGDAISYQWFRGPSGNTGTPVTGAVSSVFTTPALTADTKYWVRATNAIGATDSLAALVTVDFTDPTLVAGSTVIKKQHWDEVAARINAEEVRAGRAVTQFRALSAGASTVLLQDYWDRRTAIDALFSMAGLTAVWHSVPSTGSLISRVELNDLRANLHTLEDRLP